MLRACVWWLSDRCWVVLGCGVGWCGAITVAASIVKVKLCPMAVSSAEDGIRILCWCRWLVFVFGCCGTAYRDRHQQRHR